VREQPPDAGPQGVNLPPGDGGEIALACGETPVAGYVLRERLGKGTFGDVWKAEAPAASKWR
jgi:hypothetical protein